MRFSQYNEISNASGGDFLLIDTVPLSAASTSKIKVQNLLPASLPPSGSATGDLAGSYPNPTVVRLNGQSPAAVATSGSYLDLTHTPTLGTLAALNSIDLTANVTGILPAGNGGASSSTYVDLSSTQTVGGAKTFSSTPIIVNGQSVQYNGPNVAYDISGENISGDDRLVFKPTQFSGKSGRYWFDSDGAGTNVGFSFAINGSEQGFFGSTDGTSLDFQSKNSLDMRLQTDSGTTRLTIQHSTGHVIPGANGSQNLGSSSLYWSNLYANTLNLNSTASLDGGTAGVVTLTGQFNTASGAGINLKPSNPGSPVNGDLWISSVDGSIKIKDTFGTIKTLLAPAFQIVLTNFSNPGFMYNGTAHPVSATSDGVFNGNLYLDNASGYVSPTNYYSVVNMQANFASTTSVAGYYNKINFNSKTPTITSLYGFFQDTTTVFAGSSVTNLYGLYVGGQSGATNNYAIYTNAGINYFGDKVGILTSGPTHTLTLGSTATGIAIYNTSDQTTNYQRTTFTYAGIAAENGGTGSQHAITINSGGRILTLNGGGASAAFSASTTAGSFLSLSGTSNASSTIPAIVSIAPNINQSSTAGYTALLVNPTETTTGSGTKLLIDAHVGAGAGFKVDNGGYATFQGAFSNGDISVHNIILTSNNTYSIGSPSAYAQYIYGSRLYLNSTSYFDGGTAGQIGVDGVFAITSSLPASGTAGIGGYFNGIGISGNAASATSHQIFGVLASDQSGSGVGAVNFTITSDKKVYTFNNILDDGMGNTTLASVTLGTPLAIANGGTGSATQNFVDTSSTQSINGTKTFTTTIQVGNASNNGRLVIYDSTNNESGTISRSYRTSTNEGAFFMDELQITGGRFSFDPGGGKAEIDVNGTNTLLRFWSTQGHPLFEVQDGTGSVTNTNLFGTIQPGGNNTQTLGTPSLYWSSLYSQVVNFNSTASLSGVTAGQIAATGQFYQSDTGANAGTGDYVSVSFSASDAGTYNGALFGMITHPITSITSKWNVGAKFNPYHHGSVALNTMKAFYAVPEHSGTATINSMAAVDMQPYIDSTGGVTTLNYLLAENIGGVGTGTIGTLNGFNMQDPGKTVTGQLTGIYINSLTSGATNYAIYTNSGKVLFGDNVTMNSSFTVMGAASSDVATFKTSDGASKVGIDQFGQPYPYVNGSLNFGGTSAYWNNGYFKTLNLNSTASLSGSTAGWASLTGSLAIGAASDPLSWAGLYTVNGFRADNDFRFQKASGAQYISRLNGSGSGGSNGYDLVFQVHSDNITLFGAGGLVVNNSASSANYFQVNGGTNVGSLSVGTNGVTTIGQIETTEFKPNDHNLIAWNFDPVMTTTSTAISSNGALMYCVKIPIPVATTISYVYFGINGGGSTLTSGECFAALYSNAGSLLSATADQSTAWLTSGLAKMALTTPQAVSAGYVYVAWFCNGTTGPSVERAPALQAAVTNANLAAGAYRFATINGTFTTSMPATLGTMNNSNLPFWAAVS